MEHNHIHVNLLLNSNKNKQHLYHKNDTITHNNKIPHNR